MSDQYKSVEIVEPAQADFQVDTIQAETPHEPEPRTWWGAVNADEDSAICFVNKAFAACHGIPVEFRQVMRDAEGDELPTKREAELDLQNLVAAKRIEELEQQNAKLSERDMFEIAQKSEGLVRQAFRLGKIAGLSEGASRLEFLASAINPTRKWFVEEAGRQADSMRKQIEKETP